MQLFISCVIFQQWLFNLHDQFLLWLQLLQIVDTILLDFLQNVWFGCLMRARKSSVTSLFHALIALATSESLWWQLCRCIELDVLSLDDNTVCSSANSVISTKIGIARNIHVLVLDGRQRVCLAMSLRLYSAQHSNTCNVSLPLFSIPDTINFCTCLILYFQRFQSKYFHSLLDLYFSLVSSTSQLLKHLLYFLDPFFFRNHLDLFDVCIYVAISIFQLFQIFFPQFDAAFNEIDQFLLSFLFVLALCLNWCSTTNFLKFSPLFGTVLNYFVDFLPMRIALRNWFFIRFMS